MGTGDQTRCSFVIAFVFCFRHKALFQGCRSKHWMQVNWAAAPIYINILNHHQLQFVHYRDGIHHSQKFDIIASRNSEWNWFFAVGCEYCETKLRKPFGAHAIDLKKIFIPTRKKNVKKQHLLHISYFCCGPFCLMAEYVFWINAFIFHKIINLETKLINHHYEISLIGRYS